VPFAVPTLPGLLSEDFDGEFRSSPLFGRVRNIKETKHVISLNRYGLAWRLAP
jgi:hypothetical protein